jgi:type IV pilus assembly protein PilB
MSEVTSESVICTPIGVMTYLAPTAVQIDDATLERLHTFVDQCVEERRYRLVVDLSRVHYLDSRAMEALLDLQDKVIGLGGWLKVAQVGDTIREALRITRITNAIALLDDEIETRAKPPASAPEGTRLGDRFVAKGLLGPKQLEEALALQQQSGKRLGEILIHRGLVSEQEVLATLGEQLDVPFVRLRPGLYDASVVRSIPKRVAERLNVVPLFQVRGEVTLAMTDAQSVPLINEVEERLRCRVRPVLARSDEILKTISDSHDDTSLTEELVIELDEDFELMEDVLPEDLSIIDEMAAGSPVVNTVNSIIQRAVREGASDIHLEPSRGRARVRFRIDGVLYEIMRPRMELHPALVSRLKVMANLDIAERRLPQDGRIQVHTQGRMVDLRFSSLPGLFGEKVVLRVLDKSQAILDVDNLGMESDVKDIFLNLLGRSYGLVLVTGPTGSGKTTSLYAALSYLNSIEKNIVTIEDPIEYQLEIINQNEVRPTIGLTFAKMLKHVLRQDPDIVMVGEIRERETAEIAVQAALTGHLVLSTLHTNDSVGAVTRMIEMGVEPYLLSSALAGVIAQRLVRTICKQCKTTFLAPPEIARRYGWPEGERVQLARGRGCPECFDSGYRGRVAIHEVIQTDPELQHLIISNPTRDQLDNYFATHSLKTLLQRGVDKARRGDTTIEEIGRVVSAI